jgi:transcriptional regulator with XRE-family HTH domain/Zn-dependent peptidase ImmA (M78 family)
MIKNERQYRITRAQLDRFSDAIKQAESSPAEGIDPLLKRAHQEALHSQFKDLEAEVSAYEALQTGSAYIVEVESFDELPSALIRARIASGLSQKELAERLGLKEQQVQRYEATNYSGASFTRLSEVVKALGISVREDIFVPTDQLTIKSFLQRLEGLGLDKDFVKQRLFSRNFFIEQGIDQGQNFAQTIFKAASALRRMFGWSLAEILGPMQPQLDLAIAGAARFKLPARIADRSLGAYTHYAYHLSQLALEATSGLVSHPIPRDPVEICKSIRAQFGEVSFKAALDYVWNLGVVVLPLDDPGAFHGACWRIGGRNVIVLKQKTKSEARWLFDLLHELWHAGEEPELAERTILELPETDPERRNGEEEKKASRFAGNVVLEGRAEMLIGMIVKETGGEIPLFKSALPRIAKRENVPADSLANYLAFRLSLQRENWWGTASNLQTPGDPWLIARDTFLLRSNISRLDVVDCGLLARALEEPSEVAA